MDKLMNALQIRLQTFLKSLQENAEKKIQNEKLQDLEQGITKAAKDMKNSNSLHKQTIIDLSKAIPLLRQSYSSQSIETTIQLVQEAISLFKIRISIVTTYFALSHYEPIPNYSELIRSLQSLREHTDSAIHNPNYLSLKKNICLEIEAFQKLLETQIEVSELQFLNSIFGLQCCKVAMESWKYYIGLDSIPTSQRPINAHWGYLWLSQFYANLVAKSGLYFYSALKQKEEQIGTDPKQPLSIPKVDVNHFAAYFVFICNSLKFRIEFFCNKSEPSNFSIIVDTQKLSNEPQSTGYVSHPSDYKYEENLPSGIKSWPAVFSYPKEPPVLTHWPNIISVIFESVEKLNKYKDVVIFVEKRIQTTYFISKVEPNIYMVILYEKKKENEVAVKEFMLNLCASLRLSKLIHQLK